VLDRNLMTCILACREVAPEMMKRKSGSIVNIGSVDGLWGQEKSAIYATAKAAVHEYTRCLALLLRPHNIRVNAIAPGDVMTPAGRPPGLMTPEWRSRREPLTVTAGPWKSPGSSNSSSPARPPTSPDR